MFDLWLWDLFSINMSDGVKPSAYTRSVRLWHNPSNKITCRPKIKEKISSVMFTSGELKYPLCPAEKHPQSNSWPRIRLMVFATMKASRRPLIVMAAERG